MNILMYSDSFGGNTTTFINNEVEYMSKKHTLLYVCTKKLESGIFNYGNLEVIDYSTNTFMQKILWRLWKYDIYLNRRNDRFRKKLNNLVKEFKPDVIHCHFGYEALRVIDNLENTNIPIVIHFHGYDATAMLKKRAYVKRLKEVLKKENIFPVFVSHYLQNNLTNHGINTSKGTILHCGIDLSKFVLSDRITGNNDEIVFLQVSSLVEKKGHEYTLQSFAKFLNNQKVKNYKLILTGDGERKKTLQELVIQLGIEQYVDFVGFVSPIEAKELMQKADVFVHHSITAENGDQEGIPTALMEAMAMELPVISSMHSGIPELVIDGENGYLVEEKDVDNYAKKMADILDWGKINKNRDIIDSSFEMQKHNNALENLYIKIVNDK